MRTELERIKYIEEYLTGQLPSDEVKSFEEEVANNPELAQEVEFQNQIIKRAQRAAMREQFEAIHQANFSTTTTTKKWWQKNIWLNGFLLLFLLGGIVGIFTNNNSENPKELGNVESKIIKEEGPESQNITSTDQEDTINYLEENSYSIECADSLEEEVFQTQPKVENDYSKQKNELDKNEPKDVEKNDEITKEKPTIDSLFKDSSFNLSIQDFLPVFDTLTYIPTEGLVHQYTRSGTEIRLPKNLIKGNENSSEPIKLLYREYRNQADIAFSGIPMFYTENDCTYEFESGGMFEFTPLDKSLEMNAYAQNDVELDFVLTNTNIDLDYYELENEKWVKKAKIIEKPDRTKQKNRKPLRLKCEEEKICKFQVTEARMDEILSTEKRRRNPFNYQKPVPNDLVSYGIRSLVKYIKKRREKRKGIEPKKEEYKDVYGTMEFEVLIPNKSYRKRIKVENVHIEEALVYQKEPLRCYEARELLFSILDKNCNTCRHEIHLADSIHLAQLKKPLFNLDSLNHQVEKRNNTKSTDDKISIIEEVFNEESLNPEYYVNNDRVVINPRGFGTGNCDAFRRTMEKENTWVRDYFKKPNREVIMNVEKVSVLPLNFSSASSYPIKFVQVNDLTMRTLFIFSKDGLYYINNQKLRGLIKGDTRNRIAQKLPLEINSAQALMEFIDKERRALIEN